MKWKKREQEIAKLRAKHGKDRSLVRGFPDLTVDGRDRVAPISNRLVVPSTTPPLLKREVLVAILGEGFVVSHLHKSGYQMMFKRESDWFGKKT
jgi:hypothetical protein